MQVPSTAKYYRSKPRGFFGFVLLLLAVCNLPVWFLAIFAFLYAGEIYKDPDPWIPVSQSVACALLLCWPITLALFAKQVLNSQCSLREALMQAFRQTALWACVLVTGSFLLKYLFFY